MSLKNYLQNFMPRLKRRELNDAIEKTRVELNDVAIPEYEAAAEFFGNRKFKSKWVEQFDQTFNKEFRVKHKGNFIQAINDTLPLLSENLNSIERLMDADREINFSRDAVSLMNLNLVRAVDHMRFLTEYASRLLNAALAMEVNIAKGNKEFHEVPNAELDWLNNNKTMFIGAYSLLTMKKADFDKRIKEIPAVTVGQDNIEMVEGNLERGRSDPLELNLIPLPINPFYIVGRWIAERQAARYKTAKAERDSIQLRLLYLRQLDAEGKGDPILKNEIEITQSRVEKLSYEIKEMEEKWLDNQ